MVASRGSIMQMGAGSNRHHPVRSSTRGCLGAKDQGGQCVDEDAKMLRAAELDHCLHLTKLIGFSPGMASSATDSCASAQQHRLRGAKARPLDFGARPLTTERGGRMLASETPNMPQCTTYNDF